MATAMILAAGVGQRMRSGGLPKQFLKLMGKPIVVYTLEKFQEEIEIDQIVIVCHGSYIDYMRDLVDQYHITKVKEIIVGGKNRQDSLLKGLEASSENMEDDDIVVIHDGVRPLVSHTTIRENIRVAKEYGCAITVHSVTESVVVTDREEVDLSEFKKRSDTYTMTSPQSFRIGDILTAYREVFDNSMKEDDELPLLDAAMIFSKWGGTVRLVKEQGNNLKVTTPEDFYILKAILELEENRFIFGL